MKRESIGVLGLILISTITLNRVLSHYIKGGKPDILQTLLSIACILCWMLASYYYGKAGSKNFLIFTLSFFSIGFLIQGVYHYTEQIYLLTILTYVIMWLPLYGIIGHFDRDSFLTEPISATVILLLLPTALAYILGKRLSR